MNITNEIAPVASRPGSSGLRDTINEALQIEGALAAALVDMRTGRCVRTGGKSTGLRLGAFAAAATRALYRQTGLLGRVFTSPDHVEDVVITLDTQYHLVRPVGSGERVFLYCAFDREQTNLAVARRSLARIAQESPGLTRIWHWQRAAQ